MIIATGVPFVTKLTSPGGEVARSCQFAHVPGGQDPAIRHLDPHDRTDRTNMHQLGARCVQGLDWRRDG